MEVITRERENTRYIETWLEFPLLYFNLENGITRDLERQRHGYRISNY